MVMLVAPATNFTSAHHIHSNMLKIHQINWILAETGR